MGPNGLFLNHLVRPVVGGWEQRGCRGGRWGGGGGFGWFEAQLSRPAVRVFCRSGRFPLVASSCARCLLLKQDSDAAGNPPSKGFCLQQQLLEAAKANVKR